MARSDDLTPVLQQPKIADVGYHQGIIQQWSAQTGENVINVVGTDITNIPMLNITEALVLRPGHVVGLLRFKTNYFILGRIVIPAADDFFSGVMPNIATPMYQVNTDDVLQNNQVGSGYTPKLIGGHVVNHPVTSVLLFNQVSGGTATGAVRMQWYLGDPGNAGNPANGTLMGDATGLAGNSGTFLKFDYEWPVEMRGRMVILSIEPNLTAGVNGVDWCSSMPTYIVNHQEGVVF